MPSRQNGKKVAVLPMRAEMLRLLYVGKELPENDSIVNMFCGKNVSSDLLSPTMLLKRSVPVYFFQLLTNPHSIPSISLPAAG